MYICENCGEEYECLSDMHHIEDIGERVEPGEFMPAGECIECKAVCHDQEAILENLKNYFGVKEIDWKRFNHDKENLKGIIETFSNGYNSATETTIDSLKNIVATLEELQNQAVIYGYPEEEVFCCCKLPKSINN